MSLPLPLLFKGIEGLWTGFCLSVNCGYDRGEFFKSLTLHALISAGVPELISEGAKSIPTLKTIVFSTAQPILKNQPRIFIVLSINSFHLLYHREALRTIRNITFSLWKTLPFTQSTFSVWKTWQKIVAVLWCHHHSSL